MAKAKQVRENIGRFGSAFYVGTKQIAEGYTSYTKMLFDEGKKLEREDNITPLKQVQDYLQ